MGVHGIAVTRYLFLINSFIKGFIMSILSAPAWINDLCEKHDWYEYRILILVTMPDGKRFLTDSSEIANRMQSEYGAETIHVTELGE